MQTTMKFSVLAQFDCFNDTYFNKISYLHHNSLKSVLTSGTDIVRS
jgi:hypothetical protein